MGKVRELILILIQKNMEDMDGTETWEVGLGDMGDRNGGYGQSCKK